MRYRLLFAFALPVLLDCGQILIPRRPAGIAASGREWSRVERPPVTAKAEPIPGFMHGINLGNDLDAPYEGAWGVSRGKRDFEMAAAAGLDHVRLPVRFSAHAGRNAPYTIDPQFFARVDRAIEQALLHRLSIIVDLHHYEEIMKEPERHGARFLGIWSQIAERYKQQPPSVAFELLNEPSAALDSSKLNALMSRAIDVVRARNPTRLVFVDCYFWANAEYLHQLVLPADREVVPSFHMYQPILFTHQGADWMSAEFQTRGVVFPGPPPAPLQPVVAAQHTAWAKTWFENYNKLPLEQNPSGPVTVFLHFDKAEQYAARTHKRMYLGEFGAIDNADAPSRIRYIKLVREEAERHGFGWAYWDDGGKNKGMDVAAGKWVPEIEAALFN